MNEIDKTKEQLINELESLRETVASLAAEKGKSDDCHIFEKIFTSSHMLIAYLDRSFSFIKVNKAFAEALDRRESYFTGRNYFELYESRENESIFRTILETGKSYTAFGKQFVHPEHIENEGKKWDWTVQPVKDENNRVSGLILFLINATERIKADDKLHIINEITKVSIEPVSLRQQLEKVMQLILSIYWLNIDRAKVSIFLTKENCNELEMVTQSGFDEKQIAVCGNIPFGKCLCGLAAAEKKLIFTESVNKSHGIIYEGMNPHGHFIVPVISRDEVLGVINMYINEDHVYDETDEDFLRTLANSIAGLIERKKAIDKTFFITKQFQAVLEDNPMSISFKNLNHEYHTVNDTKAGFFNLPAHSLIGKTDLQLFDSDLYSQIQAKEDSVLKSGESLFTEECYIGAEGEKRCESTMIKPWRDEKDEIIGTITFGTNITKHKEWEEYIKKLAHFDALTNLPNRNLLRDRLKQAIKRCKREDSRLAILFLDLDGFKAINDTLGHSAGDELLKLVAGRLLSCVRETDTVARLGGDEFLILLEGIIHEDDAIPIAEKIIKEIAKPYLLKEENKFITTSVGISTFPKSAGNEEELIKKADIAMYGAKEGGRNRYKFFQFEMDAQVSKKLKIEEELRKALDSDSFELFYQPLIRVPTFLPDYSILVYDRTGDNWYTLDPKRMREFTMLTNMPRELFMGEMLLGTRNLKLVYYLPSDLIKEAHLQGIIENLESQDSFEGQRLTDSMLPGQEKSVMPLARTEGIEALIRWKRPSKNDSAKHEYVPPLEFIQVAEESGLIVPISEWVLEKACSQNKKWQDMGIPPVVMAVNISGRHFRSRRLITSVSDAVYASGLKPKYLKLELTENIAKPAKGVESDLMIVKLRELNSMGVKLSIDDFGTAYSSLKVLADLRTKKLISELKIAREFIREITIDDGLKSIVRSIIEMGKALDIDIVAEGIETPNQLELLRYMGCEVVQGFLFSKPMPAEKCTEYLKEEYHL